MTELIDGVTARDVVHVDDPNALTQVLGFVKFAFAEPGAAVLYRGQSRMYSTMIPSGLRGLVAKGRNAFGDELRRYIEELSGGRCPDTRKGELSCGKNMHCLRQVEYKSRRDARPIAGGTYRGAIEPLLQHYGLKTRWLDVVDNIWVALWFGCHNLEIAEGRWAHHQRRSAAEEPDGFAYIVCLNAGIPVRKTPTFPGSYVSDQANVVDLRYAAPSIYVRPHAQHGVLMSAIGLGDGPFGPDLQKLELATIRINLRDALNWLGIGSMLSTYALFPPATRDIGYRRLLHYAPAATDRIGKFLEYGPGS